MTKKGVTALNSRTPDQYCVVRIHTATLKWFIAVLPVVSCFVIIWLRNAHFKTFKRLFTEDSLFEYLTSIFYFQAGIVAIIIGWTFRREGRCTLAAAYFFLALGVFFVAGEEISWGQRILNIETPQAIVKINTQGELTIHNLEPFQRILHFTYVAVGAYGAILWMLTLPSIAPFSTRIASYIIPPWYLATYFLPVLVFYAHLEASTRDTAWFQYRKPDQEPVEFIMSLGFLLFVLSNRYRQRLEFSLEKGRIFNVSWGSSE